MSARLHLDEPIVALLTTSARPLTANDIAYALTCGLPASDRDAGRTIDATSVMRSLRGLIEAGRVTQREGRMPVQRSDPRGLIYQFERNVVGFVATPQETKRRKK